MLAWVTLVVSATFPWATLQNHPHWMNIRWQPFDGRTHPLDFVLNALLYIPGGVLIAHLAKGSPLRRGLLTLAVAGTLSLTTETAQLFSHGRVPSLVDVIANLAGALIGARWRRLS